MTPEELKSVDTSALVAELKRRMSEIEKAREELGFGSSNEAPAKRARHVSDDTMKHAALERWAGWKEYKKEHPNASTKDYFRARKKAK